MKITAKFFASVREVIGARSEVIEVAEGTTVGSLWNMYVERFPRLAKIGVTYAVNHQYSGLDRVLTEGDEVAFIPPVSGGLG